MTLTEYLEDYAQPETRELGHSVVDKELLNIPNEKTRGIATGQIEKIRKFAIEHPEIGDDPSERREAHLPRVEI